MHRSLLPSVLSLSILLSALVTAHAASYTFTAIDVPDAGYTVASGINTAGQIVGVFYQPGPLITTHGFLTSDGATFTTIDVANSTYNSAFGINESGQIVRTFDDATVGRRHGFLKDGDTFTTIDVPGAMNTQAREINATGQIVGIFSDGGRFRGFVKDGATFTIIDLPGTSYTLASGINAAGQVVGQFSDGTRDHGFLATPVEVDMSPPLITVSASPATLWPPNGKRVAVTVEGTITDTEPGGLGVQADSAAYVVMDEYGQIQPRGSRALGANSRYSVIVALEASRNRKDQDGRHYTIAVSARDNAGNLGVASTIVTVPHDQGQRAGASLTACGRICK